MNFDVSVKTMYDYCISRNDKNDVKLREICIILTTCFFFKTDLYLNMDKMNVQYTNTI